MKRRLLLGVLTPLLALRAFCAATPAEGQEPPPAPAAEAGAPATMGTATSAPAADAGALPAPPPGYMLVPVPPLPTPPPGYMLVPIPTDAGADAAAPATGVTPAAKASMMGEDSISFRHANTWDLNLEGGGGYVFGDPSKWTGFARARAGALIIRNDDFWQFGATAEYLGLLHRPAFGIQAEYMNLTRGLWVQIGGAVDTKGNPGAMGSLGWSLFGIEGQVREFPQGPDPAFALLGKIRIPVSIIVYAITSSKGK